MRIWAAILATLGALAGPDEVHAHHSFAVHFVPERTVSIRGTVTNFRFRNPHGIVELASIDSDGQEVEWRAETNSPNILRRRGWSESSIGVGDEVVIEGFPARDGSPSMRIYRVVYPDGRELVGQRPSAVDSGEED